jgi:hypothetical protein
MVPERARQVLEPLMGQGIPWDDVTVHVGRLPQATLAPSALVPRAVMAVTAKEPNRSLQTVGMTIHRDIWLARGHDDFESAAGLALLAHELVHVGQFEADPAFADKYDAAAQQTPRDQPWLNPYEAQAYEEERRIYCLLVAEGRARGRWTPLGVSLWGC